MKVEEVIVVACNMMSENAFAEKIKSGAVLTTEETEMKNKLLRCFNYVQSEIATEIFPLTISEQISSENGEFNVVSLSKKFVYLVSFKTSDGEKKKIKLQGQKLFFEGKGELEYCYEPVTVSISDNVELTLPSRVLAYGVLREFYLLQDMPSEASVMEEKFKNSLLNYSSCKKSITTPKRSWF